ncbi:MAG: hypothetical protein WBN09_10040 [Woeseiaceae bacterium]
MSKALRYLAQTLLYAMFAVFIGYFSLYPGYQYASPDDAVVKLSISHAANRIEECVKLTQEELAALAANMRQPTRCERARLPLFVELDVDGAAVLSVKAEPTGLWGDGNASIYERFEIEPGRHTITARLRDTGRSSGWDYEHSEEVEIEAGRYFTVTFRANSGGFRFR